MRDLSKVCHLGSLDTESPAKIGRLSGNSLEGSGLSVSVTPKAWRKIARLGGSDSYILTKESPRFADGLDEETQKEAIAWCLVEGLLEKVKTWRVTQFDEIGEEQPHNGQNAQSRFMIHLPACL